MEIRVGDLHHLSLLIQRMMDAEMLLETEGDALLLQTEAARQSLEAGDTETTRQQIQQIALFTEALVQTNLLALRDGRAVIRTANGILHPETREGDASR